jgi:hypothetical protein
MSRSVQRRAVSEIVFSRLVTEINREQCATAMRRRGVA